MEQKEKDRLLGKIQWKPDLEAFVSEVLRQPERIPELFAIVKADPGSAKFYCEKDITKSLLRIPENSYLYKGEPSPECRNILCGHAIDCFDKYFELAHDKNGILAFASAQTHNPRKQVAKKAAAFLKKHMQQVKV